MKLSEKFEEALIYATRAHANQTRKKTGIPFVAHILGVTAIALEYGANETEAIGALLHDTVEDCGGAERLRDIREKFGDDVTKIVDGCTDTYETPKPPSMTSPKSLMDAPTHTRRQSRRGWNENVLTSSISRTRMVRHGWYQRRISCITRVRFWLSFDDMVSKCSSGSVEKKTAPFGITEPL